LHSLLEILNDIRMATLMEQPKGRRRPKTTWKLEEMCKQESNLINALGVVELH